MVSGRNPVLHRGSGLMEIRRRRESDRNSRIEEQNPLRESRASLTARLALFRRIQTRMAGGIRAAAESRDKIWDSSGMRKNRTKIVRITRMVRILPRERWEDFPIR